MTIQIPHSVSRALCPAPHLAPRPDPAPRIVFKGSPLGIRELENDAGGELSEIILKDRADAGTRKRAARSREFIMILNYSRTPFILLE